MEKHNKKRSSEVDKIKRSTTTQLTGFFQKRSNITLLNTNLQVFVSNKTQKNSSEAYIKALKKF